MSRDSAPRVIPPPVDLEEIGPLVVVDGECAYFHDSRPSCTAFALPGHLTGEEYQRAMDLGMRRSGTVVYRPLCDDCRLCQPLRVPVAAFQPSRSQRRARKKCQDLFDVHIAQPTLDDERLALYARYQQAQHGKHAQSADEKSYRRFLVDSITHSVELSWRDDQGKLIGVGILDVTPEALSSVYFYWEPDLKKLSLGTYSALAEIDLCKKWNKAYYYVGYLVPGSRTMSYKAEFPGAEVWVGDRWMPLGGRNLEDEDVKRRIREAEGLATHWDEKRFKLSAARSLPVRQESST